MPRVIPFPPADPVRPGDAFGAEDVRLGQAWAAFAADDAKASAPAGLEARVMRAAQAALVEKRRAEAARRRHHWFAGLSALAASILAATAWWLAGARAVVPSAPESTAIEVEQISPASTVAAVPIDPRRGSAPVPMTNVEAGRVIDGSLRRLVARPLLDAADNGLVRAAIVPRAKSFLAPLVVPAPVLMRAANVPAAAPQAEDATALPGPLGVAPPAGTATAPDAWTSRGFHGLFEPTSAPHPPTPSAPKDEPPPPPPQF
jgi:hypothetical protein